MKVKQATIPSAYIKLDSQISLADEVVNVHDQHVFRQNHNALLAKRVRKDLVSQAGVYTRSTAVAPSSNALVNNRTRHQPDGEPHSRVISVPVYVTQLTQQLRFWCYACMDPINPTSEFSGNPNLYASAREPNLAFMGDVTDNAIAVTAGSSTPTFYAVDFPLPPRSHEWALHFGREPFIVDIYLDSPVDDDYVYFGPQALVDVDRRWFVIASNSLQLHDLVYTSNTRIEPRTPVAVTAIGGGNYKYFLDDAWSEIPTPGTDTISARQVIGVWIYSFGIQELEITDFNEDFAI